jgi:hypothetical protein
MRLLALGWLVVVNIPAFVRSPLDRHSGMPGEVR